MNKKTIFLLFCCLGLVINLFGFGKSKREIKIEQFKNNIENSTIKFIGITPERLRRFSDEEIAMWVELSELQKESKNQFKFFEAAFSLMAETAKERKKVIEEFEKNGAFLYQIDEAKNDVNNRIKTTWNLWKILSLLYKLRAVRIVGFWLFED